MKEKHGRRAEGLVRTAAQTTGAGAAPTPWRMHSRRRRSVSRFSEAAEALPWRVQTARRRREARSEQPSLAPDTERVLEEAAS